MATMDIGPCGASPPLSWDCPIGRQKRLIHALCFRRMKIFTPQMMPGATYAISSTTPPWSSIGAATRPAPDPSCFSTFPADRSRTMWSGEHGSRWVSSLPWSKVGVADDLKGNPLWESAPQNPLEGFDTVWDGWSENSGKVLQTVQRLETKTRCARLWRGPLLGQSRR